MAAKGISTSFRGALLEQVQAYAERGGMSLQDAVRELVELGLSMAPNDTVILNARQRAYDDTRRWAMARFSEKINELSRDAERALGLAIWGNSPPKTEGQDIYG